MEGGVFGNIIIFRWIFNLQLNNKKIRILLVNNTLTSLFMADYLKQVSSETISDYRTIVIYSDIDFTDSSWESTWGNKCNRLIDKKRFEEEGCKIVLQGLVDEWIKCMPDRYANYQFNWRKFAEIKIERDKRRNELIFIKKTLEKSNINPRSVFEIWYSNNSFAKHFFYLCENAVGFSFEHGLGDIINLLNKSGNTGLFTKKQSWYKNYFKKILIKLQYTLIYFPDNIVKRNNHVSLLAEELKRTNSSLVISKINPRSLSNFSIKNYISEDCDYIQKQNSVFIMMPDVLIMTNDRDKNLNFYKEFEKYLLRNFSALFNKHKIKVIVFKPKTYLDNFSEEGFNSFKELESKYMIKYLPIISKHNFPAELYIPVFKPKILLGAYGSTLFYSKKMFPDLHTYSFDIWFNNYCDKIFGSHIAEYDQLISTFQIKYSKEFYSIIPERV